MLVAKALFLVALVAGLFVPLAVWLERRQLALMQDRSGGGGAGLMGSPVGGVLQPVADLLKQLGKEDLAPSGAAPLTYSLAPVLAAVLPLASFAVIPFGSTYAFGDASFTAVVADVDWGLLYWLMLVAVGSLVPLLAGSSSASNPGALAGLRATVLAMSFQIALLLSLVGPCMVFGSLRLPEIVVAQDQSFRVLGFLSWIPQLPAGPGWLDAIRLPAWGIFLQPLAFLLFLAGLTAWMRRSPFDAGDGPELIGGHRGAYSGVRLLLFRLGARLRLVGAAFLVSVLFLGGGSLPYLPQDAIVAAVASFFGQGFGNLVCLVVHLVSVLVKVAAVVALLLFLDGALPRRRTDQAVRLCWKWLVPLSLVNLFATAAVMLLAPGVLG